MVFQTENLSESGVLVRATPPLPVGMQAVLTLDLPWELGNVVATAVVVRHADAADEGVGGFAMRFLELEGNSRQRLTEFLNRPAT